MSTPNPNTSAPQSLRLAVVTEVFPDETTRHERLVALLRSARDQGAELAVLPELPFHAWSPASKAVLEEDAEPPGGPREAALRALALEAGIAVLGGAIVVDQASGERRNRVLLVDAGGELVSHYDKIHLPSEEGYWESDHYSPGREAPRPVRLGGFAIGCQICSDMMRPQGCQLLAAQGAEVILAPRATPVETYPRWRDILRANAVLSTTFVVSTNRPRPEAGVDIGGATLVVAPDGEVLVETTEPLVVIELERTRLEAARADYPGYLARYPELYAEAWENVAEVG